MSIAKKLAHRAARATALFGLVAAFCLNISAAEAQTKVTLALPTTNTAFSFAYLAHDLGYWKAEGLDVNIVVLTGLASTNALLSDSVEFAGASGTTLLTANARGQRITAIASLFDKLP